ncbi:UNVERIFIED_CONTAM: hypothetical protein ABID98_005519 [Brevibacillus sp. OAP136]
MCAFETICWILFYFVGWMYCVQYMCFTLSGSAFNYLEKDKLTHKVWGEELDSRSSHG